MLFLCLGKIQIHKNLLLEFYLMPLWLSEIFICNLFATQLKRQDQILKFYSKLQANVFFLKKNQELISRILLLQPNSWDMLLTKLSSVPCQHFHLFCI